MSKTKFLLSNILEQPENAQMFFSRLAAAKKFLAAKAG
jgi:hypothetical protein